jgi:hypothetical protein
MDIDIEKLKPYATTDAQKRTLDAIEASGGSIRGAARALGMHNETIRETFQRIKVAAAKGGYAPGHFVAGVAPGYAMGKVTVHRKDGVVQQTWERQLPDQEAREAALKAALEALTSELPRVKPQPPLTHAQDNALLNLFTFTDYHMGMLAWHAETGSDWDLKIAEDMLYRAFERMLQGAPLARVALINQLGDFLHTDGLKAVTPEHGHLLDADGRFPKIVAAVIRVLRRVIDRALETHEKVHVVMAEGNHDMVSSIWLRAMFSALYENEPRVTVDDTPVPYYVYRHGETFLGFHHGHLSKNQSLPALFAAKFRKEWGLTTKAYIHTGHRHHQHTQEFPGALVIQHSTLASPDAYAARGGWMSERQIKRITYHMTFGEVGSEIITPDMLVAA